MDMVNMPAAFTKCTACHIRLS